MDQQAAKQQIVDRIKQAENILVTVSANPTIDQLAACIGLTLLLNKMDNKSATAVYSGKTPPVMEFLQPQKTLETNTDSLRDFIISLDKAKADKLRYKVEDQVVRIFITPYKTQLSEKDLQFSEGDFNVDVIVTLGVVDRAHLDLAITTHGRILHDATVLALSAGQGKAPDLGQINLQDPGASSLSEMLVSLSEAFGAGLMDNQIATAFLTGIVAETDRFSNKKTSPKVMTMSAQLMAAGANQQLVISKLQPSPPPPPPPLQPKPAAQAQQPPKQKAATQPQAPKKEQPPAPAPQPPKPKEAPKEETKKSNGTLNVAHEATELDGDEVEIDTTEIHIDKQGNLKLVDDSDKKDQKPMSAEVKVEPTKEEEKKPEPLKLPETPPAVPPPSLPPPPIPSTPEPKPPAAPPLPPKPEFGVPVAQQATPPSPPITALGDLPPLPSPMPPPEIKMDAHTSANDILPPPPANMAIPTDAAAEANHHALLDPLARAPGTGGAFSADTTQSSVNGGMNVDPVNNGPSNGSSEFAMHTKVIKPPAPHNTPLEQLLAAQNTGSITPPLPPAGDLTPDSARQAVENAYASAPFNPDLNPTQSLGASPPVELHQAPPTDQNASQSMPEQTPQLPIPPTAPPPMPPPIAPQDPNGPLNTPYGPMPPPSLL